jgi:hypothetical protein
MKKLLLICLVVLAAGLAWQLAGSRSPVAPPASSVSAEPQRKEPADAIPSQLPRDSEIQSGSTLKNESATNVRHEAYLAAPISKQGKVLVDAMKQLGMPEAQLAREALQENPAYAEVFKALGCEPLQQQELMKLVDARRRAKAEALFGITQLDSPTNGDASAITRQRKQIESEYTEKILDAIGEESMQKRFVRWESTLPQRRTVARLEENLGRTFSPSEVERLVDTLSSTRSDTSNILQRKGDAALRQKVLSAWRQQVSDVLTAQEMESLLSTLTTPKTSDSVPPATKLPP